MCVCIKCYHDRQQLFAEHEFSIHRRAFNEVTARATRKISINLPNKINERPSTASYGFVSVKGEIHRRVYTLHIFVCARLYCV